MLTPLFFSLKPLPQFGRYEPTYERMLWPSRKGQRWIIQMLVRFAVAASCTNSAAAFDLDLFRPATRSCRMPSKPIRTLFIVRSHVGALPHLNPSCEPMEA